MRFEIKFFVTYQQITALNQRQTKVASQIGLFKISFVVGARGQQRNVRLHARGGAQSGIPINAGMEIPATDRLEKLICKILQKGILPQTGITPRLFNIVGLQADSTHDGAPKIKK